MNTPSTDTLPLLHGDEPFKGLDAQTKERTVDTVMEYIKRRTAILISHGENELLLCDTLKQTQEYQFNNTSSISV